MVHAPFWCQTWTWSCPGCDRSLCERAKKENKKTPKHTRPISEACGIRKNQVENGKRKLRLSNLSIAADHDVVTVAISNTQDISGYTVACTWQSELLDGPVKSITVNAQPQHLRSFLRLQAFIWSLGSSLPRVPLFEPVKQSILVECRSCCYIAAGQLDVCDCFCRWDDLNQPGAVACCQATIWYNSV